MANWKALNDRKRREATVRKIVGEERYKRHKGAFENADAVQEAARFVRQMREHARLTQKTLGDRLGVTQARISEIEKGGSPDGISYALLKRVARACNLPDWPAAPNVTDVRQKQDVDPMIGNEIRKMTAAILRGHESAPPHKAVGGVLSLDANASFETWGWMEQANKAALGADIQSVILALSGPNDNGVLLVGRKGDAVQTRNLSGSAAATILRAWYSETSRKPKPAKVKLSSNLAGPAKTSR